MELTDDRLVVPVTRGRRYGWLSHGGFVDAATLRVEMFEPPRVPIPLHCELGSTPAEVVASVGRITGGEVDFHTWVSMDVAEVRAEFEVAVSMGGERHCLWQPTWEKTDRIPVPVELTIVRGARWPGMTCTSIGVDPELCETCPARRS